MSTSSALQKSLLLFMAVGAAAFASNPNEKSFKKFVEESMKQQGSSWFERKLISQVTSVVYERKVINEYLLDYYSDGSIYIYIYIYKVVLGLQVFFYS